MDQVAIAEPCIAVITFLPKPRRNRFLEHAESVSELDELCSHSASLDAPGPNTRCDDVALPFNQVQI